jgi:hypothetical protein
MPPNESDTETDQLPVSDRLGVVHVDGKYHFTDINYLNEGAAVASELGTNVLKVWFRFVDEKYSFNSEWPRFESLREMAEHPYFTELFERPFRSILLVASSYVDHDYNHYFRDGITDEQYQQEVQEFYDLTAHLLREYRGTNKTFVLQNWESDWAVLGSFDRSQIATEAERSRLTRWLNARQEGIRRARAKIDSDVTVLGAVEVNLIRDAQEGTPRVINTVVPRAEFDLVSVSLWDVLEPLAYETDPNKIAAGIQASLEYAQSHAGLPNQYAREALGGLRNVYIGELGWPIEKNSVTESMRLIRTGIETALHWGARYVLYWQVFDNELASRAETPVHSADQEVEVKGHYLISPDGTKAASWDYFSHLLREGLSDGSNRAVSLVPVTLVFDRTVPEHTLNKQVSRDTSRELAIACSHVEFVSREGRSVVFNIGNPGDEPVFGTGAWEPERTGTTSWRWFGGPDAATTFYVEESAVAESEAVRFEASAAQGPVTAEIRVDNEPSGAVVIDDAEWLGERTVSL